MLLETVYIPDLSIWEILFYRMLKRPVAKDDQLYVGSLTDSLDRRKLFEVCEELEQAENDAAAGLMPYKHGSFYRCDAIVNVKFDDRLPVDVFFRIAGVLNSLQSAEGLPAEQRKEIPKFRQKYEDNQSLHDQCDEAEQDLIKAERTCDLKTIQRKRCLEEKDRLRAAGTKEGLEQATKSWRKSIVQETKAQADVAKAKKKLNELKKKRRKSMSDCQKILEKMIGRYAKNELQSTDGGRGLDEWKLMARGLIYHDGFKLSLDQAECHYVMYKRSSGKAKQGSCLFIREEAYAPMMRWNWLDREINRRKDRKYDITAIKAYETLVNSSIVGTVRIKPDQILLIDSVESERFSGNRRLLKAQGDRLELVDPGEEGTEKEKTNIIWDGQALVDESIFKDAGYTGKDRHGMMLLRNHFFKACAFHTKIRKYYRDNRIKNVSDAFGRTLKADKIRMIVTKDSLKYLRFMDDLGFESEQAAYEYWLKNIPQEFGIVKTESASRYGHGSFHEGAYQALNTLPITRSEMKELLEKELDYLKKLNRDPAYMLYHLRYATSQVRTRYFIYTLLRHCEGFENTRYYRRFLGKETERLSKRLRQGKIKLEGDFYVLCSMPLEMLEYSAARDQKERESLRKKWTERPYLQPGEACIPDVGEGEQITLFRYPHMSMGSVCVLKNHIPGEYLDYFSLSNEDRTNIIIVSPWKSNIMARLGGADFDSDEAFYCRNPIIQKAAARLTELRELSPGEDGLPVAEADESLKRGKNKGYYNWYGLTMLDCGLAASAKTIGSLSNDAQLFNSYLQVELHKGEKRNTAYIQKVYECILKLSVLNELEIDRAKHDIRIDPESERSNLRQTEDDAGQPILRKGEDETDMLCMPAFLREKDDKEFRPHRNDYWDCPVDYIGEILDEQKAEQKGDPEEVGRGSEMNEALELEGFFRKLENTDGASQADTRKIKRLQKILGSAAAELTELTKKKHAQKNLNRDQKKEQDLDIAAKRDECNKRCMEALIDEKKLNEQTVLTLIKHCFTVNKETGMYKYPEIAEPGVRYIILGLLFEYGEITAKKGGNIILSCLKRNKSPGFSRSTLKKDEKGDIDLWGDKLKMVELED